MKSFLRACFFGSCSALSLALVPLAARADDPCDTISNLVSRPTVTNAACTVEPNHTLIETGYTNTSASSGGNSVAYPQALVRIGTSIPRLEVQVSPTSVVRTNGQRGMTDFGGGLKYLFVDTLRTLISAQANTTAPTGDAVGSSGATQTAFAVNTAYTLSPVFSIAGSQTFTAANAAGIRYGAFGATLVLTAALPRSASSVFAEYSLQTRALGPLTPTRSQYIVGALHDFGKRLQLDGELLSSPTAATGKYSGVGFGVSYLF